MDILFGGVQQELLVLRIHCEVGYSANLCCGFINKENFGVVASDVQYYVFSIGAICSVGAAEILSPASCQSSKGYECGCKFHHVVHRLSPFIES
ncbi:hypothetical protein D3C76_953090 [compost metagenome]